MEEIAPCPFCEDGGKPFPFYNQTLFLSYTVKCHKCHAQGPHVKFDPSAISRQSWESIIAKPRSEAIARWNEWQSQAQMEFSTSIAARDWPEQPKLKVIG